MIVQRTKTFRSMTGDSFQQSWDHRVNVVTELLRATKTTEHQEPNILHNQPYNDFEKNNQFLNDFAAKNGLLDILKTAIDISPLPGFDPVSHAFYQVTNMKSYVARWRKIISLHSRLQKELGTADQTQFHDLDQYVQINQNSMFVQPANYGFTRESIGHPLIFMGAIIGLIMVFGPRKLRFYQDVPGSVLRLIIADGRVYSNKVDPVAPWLITWEDERGFGINPILGARKTAFSLSNIFGNTASRDSFRVAEQLATQQGRYPAFAEMANRLHLSERTLARRLAGDGTNYKTLVRHSRLQQACDLMAKGVTHLDDLAFTCGFVDRQFMSREFRALAGFTPADYRDLLHTSVE